MNSKTLLGAAFGIVGLIISTFASASIIGNPVVDRANADQWSNFIVALTSQTFTHPGTVGNWSVWAANSGNLGLLVLEDLGSNSYSVKGADQRTVSAGLNTFAFTPNSGSASVQAGWLLGLWIGSAKVDYSSGGQSVAWCSQSGCSNELPVAGGDTLTLGSASVPGSGGGATYSVQASVPEPGSLALFGLGLLGLAMGRKRWSRRAAPLAA
ncbi:MAG: PEP-CTERM sorting domain-containing protein [Haliea sp.]